MKRSFLLIMSFCVFLGYDCALGAEICNRVVAVVNRDVITLHELNAKIKEVTGAEPAQLESEARDAFNDTRRKVLDMLIDEKIAQEKIKELGINVRPEQVDAAIERIKLDNKLTHENLTNWLKERGISFEKYRENVRGDLERMQLINFEVKSKIIIREEQIKQYYEEHPNEFASEGRVRLANIFLKYQEPSDPEDVRSTELKAREIISLAKNGEDFSALARKFSQGPGAKDGGDLGFFKTSQLDRGLSKIVNGLPVGGVSEPIKRPAGIQIVKLVENQKSETKSYEDLKSAIYAILYREEINRRYTTWIKELREKAYTKIVL